MERFRAESGPSFHYKHCCVVLSEESKSEKPGVEDGTLEKQGSGPLQNMGQFCEVLRSN